MVKFGENTEESWALPSITECKKRRLLLPVLSTLTCGQYRYQMVWTETLKTYHEMVSAEGWTDKKEINVPAVQALTFQVCSSSKFSRLQ